jgi:hypothetical protein
VVSFTRTFSPRASEKRRLFWMLGSHDRRVFFFENGTLFPYCLVFPWKRPSCDRLKGWLSAAAKEGKDGNMGVAGGGGLVRCLKGCLSGLSGSFSRHAKGKRSDSSYGRRRGGSRRCQNRQE